METFIEIIVALIGLGFFGFSMIVFVGMNAKMFSDSTTTKQEIEKTKQEIEKTKQEIEEIRKKCLKLEEEHARIDSFGFHLHSKRRR